MRRKLIVIGASGLAREMAMVAEHVNECEKRWDFLGFIGDNTAETGKGLGHSVVLGDDDWLLAQDWEADLVIGIGYPAVRARVLARYLSQDGRFHYPNLVHPNAALDLCRVELGRGNVITAHTSFTCDIVAGDFNLFNLNTTVGHDTKIGDYNVINPGVNISGYVAIGHRVLVGTGCQILEHIKIGDDAVLGAGAVVRHDVPDGQTVVGVPAKPIERGE